MSPEATAWSVLVRTADAWLALAGDLGLKASLLLLLAGAVSLALRRASASARHPTWTLGVAAVVALPVAGLLTPRWRVAAWPAVPQPASVAATGEAPAPPPGAPTRPPAVRGEPSRGAAPDAGLPERSPRRLEPPGVRPAGPARPASAPAAASPRPLGSSPAVPLFVLWLVGVATLGVRCLLGALRLRRLVRGARPVADGPWRALADAAAHTLGVRPDRIRLYTAAEPTSPLTWGVVRVAVVLPPSFGDWSPQRRRHVLLHELAHVKRLDCATQWLASFATALHWFNPLVWLASRRMLAERERACDDQVLLAGARASAYADDLLQLARGAQVGAAAARVSAAMARRSQVAGRLLAVLDPALPRAGVGRRTLAVGAGLALVLVAPLAALTAAQEAPPGAHVVEGRVVGPDGAPVAGAVVKLRTAAGEDVASAESDAAGAFRLAGDDPGPYRVRVRHPDFAPADRAASGGERLEIALGPGLAIEGRVLDATRGEPIAGVRVRVESSTWGWGSEEGTWEARTGAGGRFRLENLAPGMYSVVATAAGYSRGEREVRAGDAVDLVLFPGSAIAGVVVDADGAPVAGARVRALEGPLSNVATVLEAVSATGEDGSFRIPGTDPGHYRLEASGDGYAMRVSEPVRVEAELAARVTLELERGGFVTGTLLAADGDPTSGEVEVRESTGYPLPHERVLESKVEAGPDGRFRIGPLASGDHVLVATAPEHPAAQLDVRLARGEAEVDLGEVRLEPGLAIRGRVVDEEGRALPGAVVSAWGRPGSRSSARAAADGRFELTGLREGTHHVRAAAPGYAPPDPVGPSVAAGAEDVVLEMSRAGSVTGRIEDPEGRPVTAFSVQLESEKRSSGRSFYGPARPFGDLEGRFRLDDMPVGTHVLEVAADGFARAAVPGVVVSPGETTDVGVVRLDPGATLSGTVVDDAGSPVPGAELRLHAASRDSFWARKQTVSGLGGAYRLEGLEPGRVALLARHPDYAEERVEGIEIPPGRVELKRDVVLARGGHIEGRVRSREGHPVPGAPVTFMTSGFDALGTPTLVDNLTSTDADGRFAFRRVPAGPVQVHLFARSGQMLTGVAVARVEVQAGATAEVDFTLSEILVRGQVTRGGAPAPGLMVRAINRRAEAVRVMTGPGDSMPPASPRRLVGITDESGRYELLLDGPGVHEFAVVPESGGGHYSSERVDVPDTPVHVVDLEVPAAVVAGTVVDAESGAPLGDVRVGVSPRGEAGRPASAVTDQAGRFRLFVEPGAHRLVASLAGYVPAEADVQAREGAEAELELTLERGLELRGRVVDAAGNGVGGLGVVAVADPDSGRLDSRARTLGDGSFVLAGLEPRSYALATGSPGAGFAVHPGAAPDPDAELVLALRPAARLALRVIEAGDSPVEGVSVTLDRVNGLWFPQGRGWVDRTGPDGTAELHVPGGRLEVVASHPDGRKGTLALEVADGAAAEGEIVLPDES